MVSAWVAPAVGASGLRGEPVGQRRCEWWTGGVTAPVVRRRRGAWLAVVDKVQLEKPAEKEAIKGPGDRVYGEEPGVVGNGLPYDAEPEVKPQNEGFFLRSVGTNIETGFGDRMITFPGVYFLYTVPFLWGTFGPMVRLLFSLPNPPEPAVFNSFRLLLSSAVYVPIIGPEVWRLARGTKSTEEDKKTEEWKPFGFPAWVLGGVELGIYVFFANVVQVIGLEQTSAGRAAFLNQLQTVFVPMIGAMFGVEAIGLTGWVSAALAVGGVAILSGDHGSGIASSLTGDALEVLSAAFFAMYVLRCGVYAVRTDVRFLTGAKIFVQAALSLIWAGSGLFAAPHHVDPDAIGVPWSFSEWFIVVGVIAWTGLFSSAISGFMQTTGQKSVSASETAVILATQPIWATMIAAVGLGEPLSWRIGVGGAAILGATLLSASRKRQS